MSETTETYRQAEDAASELKRCIFKLTYFICKGTDQKIDEYGTPFDVHIIAVNLHIKTLNKLGKFLPLLIAKPGLRHKNCENVKNE